jgi:glutamate-1-semialdehyde aminotransferase
MKSLHFERSIEIFQEAKKVFAGGTMGTRSPLYADFPIYFSKAKGCRMWDVDGNEFIDLLCSIGPIILGYAYDGVDEAAIATIRESFQSSTNHPNQVELAKLLVEMVPSAERVRFLKTGTEATVAAARLSRHVTKRMHIARSGYHGWADLWRNGEEGGTHKAAWEVVLPFDGSAEGLADLFKKSKQQYAAVFLCPADTRPFTKENYQGIVDVAHKHGALVVFDEIKTGFRVAPGGAQEYLGVTPDLTTLSKGLGNGYPISAVVGKAEYMEQWNGTPTSGTFFVEALSIAASVATLREIQEKPVVPHLYKMGQRLIDGLKRICLDRGMEEAKAYADPVPSMPRFTWHPYEGNRFDNPVHQQFFRECVKRGLFFAPWHVAFVNYSHAEADIDEALNICDDAMAATVRRREPTGVKSLA